MALDVYVGTMTRYFRRDWETATAKWARESGVQFATIRPGGDAPPPPSSELRQVIKGWCIELTRILRPHELGRVTWSEADSEPYFTQRPGWPGHTALLAWAAYADAPDLPLPSEIPESLADDTAWKRSLADGAGGRFRHIMEVEWWLPIELPFVFQAPTPTSEEPMPLGSVFMLRQELAELRQETSERLARLKSQEHRLAAAADHALTLFYNLADVACDHRLPMKLDY